MQDPLYLSPLTTCNRNVETLVQRHSCLRSLTSWAKCLRNAPCQCTAHATTSADIRLFKSENFPRIRLFSILFKFALLSEYAVELKTSYRDGQRKAGCSWAGALAGAFRRHFAAFVRESKSSAIARRFPLSSYKRSTGWGKAGLHREGISCFLRPLCHIEVFCFPSVSPPTTTNFILISYKL